MSSQRFVVEGTWSGYSSSQRRVAHREVVHASLAAAIQRLGAIRYTDGTSLYLSVRPAMPRERVEINNQYGDLIRQCLRAGVNSVAALNGIPEHAP